jgi:hypothetical protein
VVLAFSELTFKQKRVLIIERALPNGKKGTIKTILNPHCHHQPINVPKAGAQAFLIDYPQGERAITLDAGLVRIGG